MLTFNIRNTLFLRLVKAEARTPGTIAVQCYVSANMRHLVVTCSSIYKCSTWLHV